MKPKPDCRGTAATISGTEAAIEILCSLERDIQKNKAVYDAVRKLNPDFRESSENHWRAKEAKYWLYGTANIEELIQLQLWSYEDMSETEVALSGATTHHVKWCQSLEATGLYSWGAYYTDDERFAIPLPQGNESLMSYLLRLAEITEKQGKGHPIGWRALRSFLDFLRTSHKEKVVFIEHIFPYKMDLFAPTKDKSCKDDFDKKVMRIIPLEAYPIPQRLTAQILLEHMRLCKTGRPDTQITLLESFALGWTVLTASRLRLPVHLEKLHIITSSALRFNKGIYLFEVPTTFGERYIPISKPIFDFLQVINQISSKHQRNTIFQRPLRSLTRQFSQVLKTMALDPKYGKITYISLLNHPHPFSDHRY